MFEHSVLRVQEVYAWENAVFYIAVYGPYKPYISHNYTQHGMFKHTTVHTFVVSIILFAARSLQFAIPMLEPCNTKALTFEDKFHADPLVFRH